MLPSDLAKILPQGLPPDGLTAHGILHTGLDSSMGEIHLALFGRRLLLMTRANTFSPARCEEVHNKPPPALSLDGFSSTWKVSTPEAKVRPNRCYAIAVPSADLPQLLSLMDQFFFENKAIEEQLEVIAQRLVVTKRTDERVSLLSRHATLLEQQGQWRQALLRRVEALQLQSYQPPKDQVQAAVRLYATQPKASESLGHPLAQALIRAEQWEPALAVTRLVATRADASPPDLLKLLQSCLDIAQRLQRPKETLWALASLADLSGPSDARRWIEQIEAFAVQSQQLTPSIEVLSAFAHNPAKAVQNRLDAAQRLSRLAAQSVGSSDLSIEGLELQLSLAAPRDQEPIRVQLLDILELAGKEKRWLSVALAYIQDGQDSTRRVSTMRRVVEVAERAGDLATALSVCRRLLDINPRDEEVILSFIRICERHHDWSGALAGRELLLQLTYDNSAVRDILHQMAIISEHLPALSKAEEVKPKSPPAKASPAQKGSAKSPPPAVSAPPAPPPPKPSQVYWERLLAIDPQHPEALEALVSAFHAQQRWGDLMDTLQRQVWAVKDDPAKLLPILRRLASLWQSQLANPRQALEVWQQVLVYAPNDLQVMRCIRDLCIETDNPEALERILDTLSVAPDLPTPERITTLLHLATLLLERPGDRDREAIDTAWRVLKLSANHDPAIELIEGYARSRFDWEILARILTHRRDLLPDITHDPLDLELASIYITYLKDVPAAARALSKVWYRNVGDAELFVRLRDLYALTPNDIDHIKAQIGLSLSYIQHLDERPDDPAPAWCAPSGSSGALTAAYAANQLRINTAHLYGRIQLPDKALDLYLDLLPTHWVDAAIIQGSTRVAQASGRAWQLVQSLKRLRATLDPDTLKHFDRVLDDLFTVLSHNPNHHTSHTHEGGQTQAPATSPQVTLLYEMAQFYSAQRQDYNRAARLYEQILALNPQHDAAYTDLIHIYTQATRWHELAHTLQRRLDTLPPTTPKRTRLELTKSLGDLYRDRLHRPELARALRSKILGTSPTIFIILALIAMTFFLMFVR